MPGDVLVDDAAWEWARERLPEPAASSGRPRVPDRDCLEGVLLVELTGIGWQQLPTSLGLGAGVTCWRRRRDWVAAGAWEEVRAGVLARVGEDVARDRAWRRLRAARRTAAPGVRGSGPARRRALLDAAVASLAESGPEGVTVEAVVARVGVGRQAFYSHFASRAALLVAVYEEYAQVVVGALAAAAARPGEDVARSVRRGTAAYFDAVGGFGAVIRALVASAPGEPEVERARESLRDRTLALSMQGLAPRRGVDAEQVRLAVRLVQAMAEQAATEWLSGRATRAQAERAHVRAATAVLSGVARPSTGSRARPSGRAH